MTSLTVSALNSGVNVLRVFGMVGSWVRVYARNPAPAIGGEVPLPVPHLRPTESVTAMDSIGLDLKWQSNTFPDDQRFYRTLNIDFERPGYAIARQVFEFRVDIQVVPSG